ncbi:hypothetical protein [Streptobacillus ratti]|uniref:hypothetical protein n=2 Tax=Streptobacillus ratti TaxID=1720557 RepID=UPI0039EBFB15
MFRNKLIGLMTISASVFGAEYYVNNDTNLGLEHSKDNNTSTTKIKASNDINLGAIFGKNKEVFTFGGVKLEGSKALNGKGGDGTLIPKGYFGLNLKKSLTNEIELILNAAYNYDEKNEGGYENSIKHLLKSRGEWDKKFEYDEEALKDYYHSQGLRFKGEETLFSGIVNYNHKLFKLHTGSIYTAGYLQKGDFRVESFVNVKTKKDNHEIDVDLNHKLKKDTYKNYGRLKLELKTTSTLDKLEIRNKGKIYLGTIVPGGKDYSISIENEAKYTVNNNLELLGGIGNEFVIKKVLKGQTPKELLYKPELKFEVKYNKDKLQIESKNKLKSRIEIKDLKLNAVEYDKSKKDPKIGMFYTGNMLSYKLGIFDVRGVGKYSGIVNIKNDKNTAKFDGLEHLASIGAGITYDRKTKNVETKNSIDGRYIVGYADNKTFSVINVWSDNKADYKVNDKLTLKGELNFTSSNRLSILNHDSQTDEILLLADTKGTLDYKINNKTDFSSTLGAKTISLFTNYKENNGNKLHLSTQYAYKVYNENELKYQLKDNIGLTGKLVASYSDGLKSERLYESLNRIKRNQVGEEGFEGFTKEDSRKIDEEEKNFGMDTQSLLVISPSAEVQLKYLNDKLSIKPRFGIDVKASAKKNDNKIKLFSCQTYVTKYLKSFCISV